MSQPLQPGDLAPDFHTTAVGGPYGEGAPVSLADFRGRPVVLYFYPKDDTPGCTTQACSLRDNFAEVSALATVLGVSIDSAKKHRAFIDKFALPFPLLTDEAKEIVHAYAVWVEKSMYGKKYMGTERTTYIIDAEGRIQAILPKVKPGEHVAQILKTLAPK